MAAKLEWSGDVLKLGRWDLARVGTIVGVGVCYAIPDTERGVHGPYEDEADAQQDCEAEVRSLLREAGVEVGP